MMLIVKGEDIIRHFIRKNDGSITLEAAMVLPFFLLFIVFFTTPGRLTVTDTALYQSASESTEMFVAYAYPVEFTKDAASDIISNKIESIENDRDVDITGAIEWANEGLELFGIDVAGGIENL